MRYQAISSKGEYSLIQKLGMLNWGLIFLICCVMAIGAASLSYGLVDDFENTLDDQAHAVRS